jgi:hypothetical protein
MLTAPPELAVIAGPLPPGALPDLGVAVIVVSPVTAATRLT